MIWVLFAFLNAFFESLKAIFSKKGVKNIDEYVIAWSLRFFSMLILTPFLFFVQIPELNNQFWIALLISGTLNAFTTVLFLKAIKHSDLSLSLPMISFTPLFMLIFSPFILNEYPNSYGLIGVLLIVFGAYVLNIKKANTGILAPFKEITKQKGPRIMLLVAFLWSLSSIYDKVGVVNSSPLFWIVSVNIFLSIMLFPVMLYKSKNIKKTFISNCPILFLIGIVTSLSLIFQMMAIELTVATYVLSIKRTSLLISMIMAYFIFKEKNIKERLVGATIMIIGVFFITYF